ncbi:MAG: ribose 5-phosphate isomerase B [Candidatus Muirbacterium halophilum]|nr:ribose 5-phosphate isomerase B [Candidatus Muirbacterium halophilum]MCK9474683.1 ribose 5-phosphate isomerase B [Candidatus Muirbacterium halophilum]
MKIVIGNDHAGVNLKNNIIKYFSEIEWINVGTDSEKSVDYPDIALNASKKILNNEACLGILICGTGTGIGIAANKVKGIRAAMCFNEIMAEYARKHNNANIVTLGARILGEELCFSIIKKFISTDFEGERHAKRVNKICAMEEL